MNREKLEEWLKDISTPTGLSYSGDRTLSNSEVDTILEYVDNLQSKIDKANEILEKILVVSDWEHQGRFRPVKNTTAQDVYKAVCMLYGILETPYRSDYGALKEDK